MLLTLWSFNLACQELWREVHTPFVQGGNAFSDALSDCDNLGILGRNGTGSGTRTNEITDVFFSYAFSGGKHRGKMLRSAIRHWKD